MAPRIHQPVWLEVYLVPTITTNGTVCMEAHPGSLVPVGLKGWTSGMRGIEERKVRGETFLTSRMKRTGEKFR